MVNTREREEAVTKFVEREIVACQSELIKEAFKKKFFSGGDIENLYRLFDGKLLSPALCVKCKRSFDCLDSETGECDECFEKNQTPQEIYEWWLVSPWLGRKLVLAGEPVLDTQYGIWWGRTTTGQEIARDYVIQQIYDDLMT